MKKINLELYKKIFLIRRAEEKIIELYPENDMKVPMHMSMGEEAIVAGVCQALGSQNQALGTYRSHALYLAKTSETDNFFLEMYGKKSEIADGKNGSMHLCSLDHGLLCCSAIVGSTIPVALGVAFANKYNNNDKIVAVFFGDGATDEGCFWESINFACLKQLPILFVYEDNEIAVHTPNSVRKGFESMTKIIAQYNMNVFEESTTDPEIIYNIAKTAIKTMKTNKYPSFVKFSYHRYLEHVGINEDYDAGYRKREDYREWYANDPIELQREKLRSLGVSEKEMKRIENKIDQKIDWSIRIAKKEEFLSGTELYKGVYC